MSEEFNLAFDVGVLKGRLDVLCDRFDALERVSRRDRKELAIQAAANAWVKAQKQHHAYGELSIDAITRIVIAAYDQALGNDGTSEPG